MIDRNPTASAFLGSMLSSSTTLFENQIKQSLFCCSLAVLTAIRELLHWINGPIESHQDRACPGPTVAGYQTPLFEFSERSQIGPSPAVTRGVKVLPVVLACSIHSSSSGSLRLSETNSMVP